LIDPILARTLSAAHDHVAKCAAQIRFDIADEVERHVLGYLATMLEVTGGCVTLAEAHRYVGIPILARTSLEAYVDLKLLLDDREYMHCIAVVEEKGWIRLLRAASEGNEYLRGLADNLDIPGEIDRRDAERRRRAGLGGSSLPAKVRWERAGMLQAYEAMYRTLSAEAHNDGRALGGRHFLMEGESARLVLYRDDPPWVASVLLDASRILYRAGVDVGQRFEVADFVNLALEAEMDRVVTLVAGG
jgi:hypothetical protein